MTDLAEALKRAAQGAEQRRAEEFLADPYMVISYVKVGMPGAELTEVWDLTTGKIVSGAVECDSKAGWLVRHTYRTRYRKPVLERIEGRFEIRKYLRP